MLREGGGAKKMRTLCVLYTSFPSEVIAPLNITLKKVATPGRNHVSARIFLSTYTVTKLLLCLYPLKTCIEFQQFEIKYL